MFCFIICFIYCDSYRYLFNFYVTGRAISDAILEEVGRHGLEMSQCRGQAYDGASSMSGAINGCAALIRNQHPLAIYQHCRSHALNLAIMKTATTIPEISENFNFKLC